MKGRWINILFCWARGNLLPFYSSLSLGVFPEYIFISPSSRFVHSFLNFMSLSPGRLRLANVFGLWTGM
jgi:hypothetical protein